MVRTLVSLEKTVISGDEGEQLGMPEDMEVPDRTPTTAHTRHRIGYSVLHIALLRHITMLRTLTCTNQRMRVMRSA